jgi:hypothetical protein
LSDYTKTTNFTAKDALTTGNAAKVIKGSEHDTEYDNIATAIATKYDSGNLASQAQGEAGTDNTVLMTPLRTEQWSAVWAAENGGMIANIHALADPGADTLLGWDNSATDIIAFTLGDGIESSTTSIRLASSVAGDLLDYSSGVLSLTDVAAGANNPMNLSGTTWSMDITALGATTAASLSATDTMIMDVGGTASKLEVQEMGMRVQTAQTTQTLAAADMNSIMEFTGTATLTLPLNATTALPVGVPVVLNMKHATQELTVTAATSVTLVSIYHPAGGSAASDTVSAGGTAVLYKTAADVWCIAGDITT